ncbi:MAG: hypothetical protein ACREYE_11570 [Gammaproteobacteria bacterium]
MKIVNRKKTSLTITDLKAVALSVALVCAPALARADDYDDSDFWQNTQEGISETNRNVWQRLGNSWEDVKHRVHELRKGLTGVREDAYDQIDEGMSHFDSHCESETFGAK